MTRSISSVSIYAPNDKIIKYVVGQFGVKVIRIDSSPLEVTVVFEDQTSHEYYGLPFSLDVRGEKGATENDRMDSTCNLTKEDPRV